MIGPPHIGTLSTTPIAGANAPPTNPATMNAGIHFLGSFAANGIEPSVIPKNPITDAVVPAVISCSSILIGLNLAVTVEKNNTAGGNETATAQTPLITAISPVPPAAISAAPCDNINEPITMAILLTGPPKSKQIIAPINPPASHSMLISINPVTAAFNPNDIAYRGIYPTNAIKKNGITVHTIGIINSGTSAWNGAHSTLSVNIVKYLTPNPTRYPEAIAPKNPNAGECAQP